MPAAIVPATEGVTHRPVASDAMVLRSITPAYPYDVKLPSRLAFLARRCTSTGDADAVAVPKHRMLDAGNAAASGWDSTMLAVPRLLIVVPAEIVPVPLPEGHTS